NPRRRRARVERALQTLALLETQAQALGIPLETLYAPWGEKPVFDPDAGAVPERCPWPPRDDHAALSPPGAATPPPPEARGGRELPQRCGRQAPGSPAAHTPRSSSGLGTPWPPCCTTWVEIMVVATSVRPNRWWIVRISVPRCSRWVAHAWRKVWALMALVS